MAVRPINLDTFSLSLLTAKEDILNPRASTNWALFAYDGLTNNLKLSDSGAGGLAELAGKFQPNRAMYGLSRLEVSETGLPRIAMICWVGESVDEYRRTECASHVPAIKAFFKEAQAFVSASAREEVTEEKIGALVTKAKPPMERMRRTSRSVDKEETVGTNYRKTNAAMEMRRINRDSFWARAEREEEARKEEERRRASDERRRLERERIMQERRDAEERDRKMNEKLQKIEEQRRIQAQLEAEVRKKEKTRWEQQQREHEDDMRARFKRSESIEKAAEAAVLVSQRSMNPREFFRQLSSTSQSPSSPMSPRTAGKPPFRRYQRSLTDTAFIFERSNSSGPTSPLSPPLTSPFSRTPTFPERRSMSPPSPGFRPITSPQRPRAHIQSPPTSPQSPTPPFSSLPSLPSGRPPPPQSSLPSFDALSAGISRPPAPATPPSLLASREQSVGPFSPPLNRQEPEQTPQAPVAALPASPPQANATRMLRDLDLRSDITVTAVLVEEAEEEEEEEKEKSETKLPSVSVPGTVSEAVPGTAGEAKCTDELPLLVKQENVPEEELPITETDDSRPEANQVEPNQPINAQPTPQEEQDEEPENQPAEAVATEEAMEEAAENGVTEMEECEQDDVPVQNGTGHVTYSAELEECSEELSHTIVGNEKSGEDFPVEKQMEDGPENGEEPIPDGQLCVRALYDYQAEDETELSFEPGDIISAVETVDKAWWRGFSKDGRQGLFPANYVETI